MDARIQKHAHILVDYSCEIKKGDRVITSSGIYGTIVSVKERTVGLLIADGVKVEIEKGHVVNKLQTAKDTVVEGKKT